MSNRGEIEKALIEGWMKEGVYAEKAEAPKKAFFNGAWHDEAKLRRFLKLED